MKNAIGILGVLYIVVLSAVLASDLCPAGQYQDRSLSCVNCSSCQTPKDVIIRPCDGLNDVVCGASLNVEGTTQKTKKNKKTSPLKKNQKKSAETGNEGGAFFESSNTYNFMLEGPNKNKSRKNNDATKVKSGKENEIDAAIKSSNAKLPLDKNGKHIKKDLSVLDETHSDSNQTSSRSKQSDGHRNSLSKKNVTKAKKHEDKKPVEEKWRPRIIADFVNHRISVEEEPTPSRHFTPVLSDNPSNILAYPHLRPRAKLADTDDNDEADDAEDEDADEEEYSDDDDDDDEDDNDDYDDDTSTVDGKKDEDDLNSPKRKPDVSKDTLSTTVNDPYNNDSEEVTVQNKYEVNVQPYNDTNNWQLLILILAVSACLLFFVVVNAYLCVYMKKWRHMKQDFETDVEDLSVRINLMQHAGFEADESNNMKNYVTQLKGGRSSTEKVPK